MGMRPRLGFRPTKPQNAAGMRIEPPMSVPSANGTQPPDTATPEPPDEPPGVRVASQGLRVTPQRGLVVKPAWANSGVVVLPITMAPAAHNRSTIRAERSGTVSPELQEPSVVRWPAVGVRSLIATGTPCSGPSARPSATARSARAASAIASSSRISTKQLKRSCSAWARRREQATSSVAVRRPVRTASAMPPAVRRKGSSTAAVCVID